MRTKSTELSAHSKKVLALLAGSSRPLSAYDILDKLGIKAPPTVYRALEALTERGLAHRIESLNAFVACHDEHKDCCAQHHASFAVCRACKKAVEIHDHHLADFIGSLGKKLHFKIEHEVLELSGLCEQCQKAVA